MDEKNEEPVTLSMKGIAKSFGGVRAIQHADLELRTAEVHALLGENGAGKSTLMNVLSGVIQQDAGEIVLNGQKVSISSPSAAQALGIAMIHQELDLVPGSTVAENLFLGREPRGTFGQLNRRSMDKHSAEVLDRLGVTFSPQRELGSLRVGEQQMVAIAKALSEDARILVMDEPTSALSEAEVESLLDLIPRLQESGVSIIYISHRMDEINRIADRGTVMRDGHTVDTFEVALTPPEEVITKMIGKPIEQVFPTRHHPQESPVILSVKELTVESKSVGGRAEPKDISFDLREGEIIGLAGLLGAGRTELLQTLYGAASGRISGNVTLSGKSHVPRDPSSSLDAGIALVPEDRRADGLVMPESVASNIVLAALGRLSKWGFRSLRREDKAVSSSIERLKIKVSKPSIGVGALSGGNQQKVVFAKQLECSPKVLLLDEPTRGVDIGAKAEIYRLLSELTDAGIAVIMASSELPELVGLCDRILVLRDGRVASEISKEDATSERILAAAGVGDDLTPLDQKGI